MRRRQFLAATTGVSLAALAASCRSDSTDSLKIALLEGSVPPQLIQAFKRQQSEAAPVSVTPADSLLKLYELLQNWQQQPQAGTQPSPSPPIANWVTQGDYWLAAAIQQQLIQPLDVTALNHWPELPDRWSQLVRRDGAGAVSPAGELWGVPYRWSSLAILYNPAKLPSTRPAITRWQDLLWPELERRVMLPDHPRVVIGLGLKAVNAAANGDDPATVSGLTDFLEALQPQVRAYSSDYYLESLIIGDASAVVGWAAELQPVLQQYHQFSAVVPGPGTLLGADLWVQPQRSQAMADTARWPDFCLTADFANQLASYSQGVSPRFLGLSPGQLPPALQQQPVFSPAPEILTNSDFLLPLSASVEDRYLELWTALRNQAVA
jgi:putative spermidine/putrescine transport system substrate-binding protein